MAQVSLWSIWLILKTPRTVSVLFKRDPFQEKPLAFFFFHPSSGKTTQEESY